MKKKIFAVLTATLIAFQCFTGLPFGSLGSMQTVASAEFEDAISADTAGMTYEADILINGQPLTENMVVKTGDTLSMDFKWKLPSDFVHVNGTFCIDLSEKLYGISLNNISIPVSTIAKYTVQDDKLYIQLLTGSSGREGGCNLKGVISLEGVDDADDGEFELKYFGNSVPVRIPEKVSGLWMNKDKNGSVYDGGDGYYYQDFRIYVGSNGDASTNVHVTDIFDTAAYSDITSIVIDGSPATYSPVSDDASTTDVTESGFSIIIPNLEANKTSTISYTLRLDKDTVLANTLTDSQKRNTATVYGNDDTSKTYSDYDSYWADLPTVYKTGSYADGKITWTITVRPNLVADADFTVTDTPDALISDAVKAELGADLQITKAEMTYDSANKCYTYSYTIDAPAANITPTNIGNKAATEFPTYPHLGTESSSNVTVPGTLTDFVKKTYTPPADDLLYWHINVGLPKDQNISSVVIEDRLYDSDYANSQKYHGDGKPVNLDHSTLDFTVYVNGSEMTDYTLFKNEGTSRWFVGKLNGDGTVNEIIGQVGNQYNGYFNITIQDTQYSYVEPGLYGDEWKSYTSAFLSNNKSNEVDFKVDIASTYNDTVLNCSNTAYANITIDGSTVSEGSRARYVKDFDSSKYAYPASQIHYTYTYEPLTNPLGWMIAVSSATYELNDIITVTDTIPAGLEYVNDSAMPYIASMDGDVWDNNVDQNVLTTTVSGNTITFSLKVNDSVLQKLNEQNESTIKIAYITQMSAAEYASFIVGATEKSYTNSAEIELLDASTSTTHDLGTATNTQTLTPDIQKIIRKEITNQPIKENDKFYAEYRITLNEAEVNLFNGSEYEAYDTLGSRLTLDGDPVITPNDHGETFTYGADNKIRFSNLQDNTTYVITYRVLVDQILANEEPLDSDTAAIEQMFGNSVSLTLSGGTNAKQSMVLQSGTYRSDAYYVFDEHTGNVTISGTKIWLNDSKHPGARPEYISVKLKITKQLAGGAETVYYDTHNIPAPATDESGSWSYTISNLITKEADGTTYIYDVDEVTVDGYEVAYSSTTNSTNPNTGIANNTSDKIGYNLDIKNTFTAAENEEGSLKVTKIWANDTAADRPDSIIITLEDLYSHDIYTETLTNGQESVTFTDLLLYVYTRNPDNSLKRELREYKLIESWDTAYDEQMSRYVTTYSSEKFTLADAVLAPYTSTTAPAQQKITNTRLSVAPAVINKTYENAEESELSTLAAATEFTLYSDAACTAAIKTGVPVVSGTDVSISFSGLDFNTTYYVKETKAPEGYTLSTDIYECKIDNLGGVYYKLYDSTDAFSTTAPTCINAEATTTPPSGDDDTPTTPPSGGDDTPTTPPSGGDDTPTAPPSGGDDTPTAPPSGGDDTPTTPPSGDDDTPTTPPSGGDDTPTTPPSGGDDTPTAPPSGDDDTPTTPPSGGDDTPTTPPSGGTDTPTTPPSGETDTPTTPPSGGDDTPVTPPEESDETPVAPPEESDETPVTPPEESDEAPEATEEPDDPTNPTEDDSIGITPDSSVEGDQVNPETMTGRLPFGIAAVAAAATFTTAFISFKDKKRRNGKK